MHVLASLSCVTSCALNWGGFLLALADALWHIMCYGYTHADDRSDETLWVVYFRGDGTFTRPLKYIHVPSATIIPCLQDPMQK